MPIAVNPFHASGVGRQCRFSRFLAQFRHSLDFLAVEGTNVDRFASTQSGCRYVRNSDWIRDHVCITDQSQEGRKEVLKNPTGNTLAMCTGYAAECLRGDRYSGRDRCQWVRRAFQKRSVSGTRSEAYTAGYGVFDVGLQERRPAAGNGVAEGLKASLLLRDPRKVCNPRR